MPAILMIVGRGLVWGLSSIGVMEATKTVTNATGNGPQDGSGGPGLFAWALVLGVTGFALWLIVRSLKG